MRFFDLPPHLSDDASKAVVLPVPFEATTTFGKGTAAGPRAVLEASQQVELYDEELRTEPCRVGIATADPVDVTGIPEEVLARVEERVATIAGEGKLPLVVGGEHSITPAAVRGVGRYHKDITVVQLDAHADLREEYDGTRYSHACAMARVREHFPAVQVGIRSLSQPEAEWIARDGLPVFYAHDIARGGNWAEKAIASIATDWVYVTIDVDVFDLSLMPDTGTPEPGGLGWYEVTDFLCRLTARKRAVGFDIVELAPVEGRRSSDFLVAKLLYKCIGYWSQAQL